MNVKQEIKNLLEVLEIVRDKIKSTSRRFQEREMRRRRILVLIVTFSITSTLSLLTQILK